MFTELFPESDRAKAAKFILVRLHKSKKMKSDFGCGQAIIDQVMPILENICGACFKDRICKNTKSSTLQRKSFNEKLFEQGEDKDRFLRIYYFGVNTSYWQYNERSLEQLQTNYDQTKNEEYRTSLSAGAEFLLDFQDAWNLNRDFFRKKILYQQAKQDKTVQHQNKTKSLYETSKNNVERDLALLNMKIDYAEVKSFKNSQEENNWIFTREKIEHAIKTMIQNIFGSLNSDLIEMKPLTVSIEMYEDALCVVVEWPGKVTEYLILQQFKKNENSYPKYLAQELFCVVNKNKKKPAGYYQKKYLDRIGLTGILKKLFIIDKNLAKPKIKTHKICFAELSKNDQNELLRYLDGLLCKKVERLSTL